MWRSKYLPVLVCLVALVILSQPAAARRTREARDGKIHTGSRGRCESCPSGHYCSDSQLHGSPIPCPPGTYSNFVNSTSKQSCLTCPAGYLCDKPGTASLESSLCPVGSFCPTGATAAVLCPPGTYMPMSGASAMDECLACPAGTTCAEAGTVTPIPCPVGKYCPASNTALPPRQCPPGYCCTSPVAEPTLAPAGFYCSPTEASEAVPCPVGTYCAAGAAAPTPCPAGTRAVTPEEGLLDGARINVESSCMLCPAGTYQQAGDRTGKCLACDEGYVCTRGSTSPRPTAMDALGRGGYMCPAGYYCPSSARAPVACPAGTFNALRGAKSADHCLPCPADTFSSEPASTSCRSCGPTATSTAGSSSCSCSRLNRVFLPGDQSCRCKPGFAIAVPSVAGGVSSWMFGMAHKAVKAASGAGSVPKEQGSADEETEEAQPQTQPVIDEDSVFAQSTYDCKQIIYARCGVDEARVASGECVSRALLKEQCRSQCNAHSSSSSSSSSPVDNFYYDEKLSLCICKDEARFFERRCDAACRAHTPVIQFVPPHPLSHSDTTETSTGNVAASPLPAQASETATANRLLAQLRNRGPVVNTSEASAAHASHPHNPMQQAAVSATLDATITRKASSTSATAAGTLVITLPAPHDARYTQTFMLPLASVSSVLTGALVCPSTTLSDSHAVATDPLMLQGACAVHLASVNEGIAPMFTLPPVLAAAVHELVRDQKHDMLGVASHEDASRISATLFNSANKLMEVLSTPAIPSTKTGSRVLLSQVAVGALPSIFCLHQHESMLFDVNLSSGSYPVYDRDSLLNTNPAFDYSTFTATPTASPASGLFAHTFRETGTYVFRDNARPDSYAIVRVLSAAESCASYNPTMRVTSVTPQSLRGMGITDTSVVTAPNWKLLGVLLALFVAIIIVVILALAFLQNVGWGTSKAIVPTYRKEAANNDQDVWTFSTKGTVTTIESRSKGTQKLEISREDLIEEATAKGDKAALKKLKYMHKADDPRLNNDEKRVLHELKNATNFEEVDFHALYKTMEETNKKMREFFGKQGELLHAFYNKTEQDVDHLKALLSIKMHVQMQKNGEGFAEAVDRLVSGELLARQAFQELGIRREKRIEQMLEDIKNRILQVTIDCNIFPIMQLLKETHELIRQAEQRLLQERARRKTFASHVEIVGREIVEALIKQDKVDADAQDDYWQALLYFDGQVQEVRSTMSAREAAHLSSMEALTNEEDRKTEQMQYHRGMVELVRIIQGELVILEERLRGGILAEMALRNEEAYDVWVHVQNTLLDKRLASFRSPSEGRMFRGINPDLAKVLTGLLGMLRSGIRINPKTGCYEPRAPFDPSDPFQTITDPGDVYREWYEEQLRLAVDQIRLEADEAKREAEEEEQRRLEAVEEERQQRERELQEEIANQRASLEDNREFNNDTVLEGLQRQHNANENVRQVSEGLEKDQKELLSSLRAKRDAVATDPNLTEDERARELQRWDDKIKVLENVLKDEAITLISYLQADDPKAGGAGGAGAETGADASSGTGSTSSAAGGSGGAGASDADPDLAPSLREIELQAELARLHADIMHLRAQTEANARAAEAAERVANDELGAATALANAPGASNDELELATAESNVLQKEEAMSNFREANAARLQALDDILQKRRQQRLMGELAELEDDEAVANLNEDDLELVRATEAHEADLEEARNRLQRKIEDVQSRQEEKRRALAEAEARERDLKRELLEGDEEDELAIDDSRLIARRRKFDEEQRLRREAELARLDEEQKRQLAAVADQEEARRLNKEFEMNRLNLLKQLNADEVAQRAKLDEALKRREDARRKKQLRDQETPAQREARHKIVADKRARGEALAEDDVLSPIVGSREIVYEEDPSERELAELSATQRAEYEERKRQREADEATRLQKRKDARRARLEAEEKKEMEAVKAKHLERLARIHHDMELDLAEQALLAELENETRALVDEAMGLAGIEVWNTLAAHARKREVESRIERAKQQVADAKESDEERNLSEAQRLLRNAAKEKEELAAKMDEEVARQTKELQDRLAARKKASQANLKEEREKRRKAEAEKLERAQKKAELSSELKIVQNLLDRVPEDRRQTEAKKLIEAELNARHQREKRDMLATQSAERRVFWKDELLKDGNADPDEVQRRAAAQFDKEHAKQLQELEAKQLEEVKDSYLALFPGANVSGPEWSADGRSALDEYARKKQQLLEEEKRKREEDYARKKKELEEKEAKLEAENRKKLEELQSKKAADEAEYGKLLQDYDQNLQRNHRALLERKQQMLDAELAANTEQTDEMRRRLLQQHQEELMRLEAKLKEEYARQRQVMVKKLQARRIQQQQRRAEDEKKRKEDEKRKKRADKLVSEKVENDMFGTVDMAGSSTSTSTSVAGGATPAAVGAASVSAAGPLGSPSVSTATAVGSAPTGPAAVGIKGVGAAAGAAARPAINREGLTQAQWEERMKAEKEERDRRQQEMELKAKSMELMAKSQVDQAEQRAIMNEKLIKIEEVVQRLDAEATQWRQSYYVDEKEATIRPLRAAQYDDSDNMPVVDVLPPEPKPIQSMNAREFVLYRFGSALIKLLTEQGLLVSPLRAQRGSSADEVTLMIATGLPPSRFRKVAFPNSYQYEVSSNTLWIRHERLVDAGEFVLVLLHALAHIHAAKEADEWDDRSPLFLAQFYRLMRLVASDMFFSRSRAALTVVGESAYANENLLRNKSLTSTSTSSSSSSSSTSSAPGENLRDLLEEADLWDSETNASLLPTTFTPRVPKLPQFELSRVDFATGITTPHATLEPAVDDLIDIHVSLIDQSVHDSESSARQASPITAFAATAPAVLASTGGMEYFSTREMLKRLDTYAAFAASTKMRKFLVDVEQKAAGYDRTRQELGQGDFRDQGRADVRADKIKINNELSTEAYTDFGAVTDLQLTDLADDLNRQLLSVVDQLYESSTRLQRLQQRSQDPGMSIAKRTSIAEKLANERVLMARLDREKAVLMQRLRHLEGTDIPNQKSMRENPLKVKDFLGDAKQARIAAGVEREDMEMVM